VIVCREEERAILNLSKVMRSHTRNNSKRFVLYIGETIMGEKGSKNKSNREDKKKPKLNIKEKRKLKNEKKQKATVFTK